MSSPLPVLAPTPQPPVARAPPDRVRDVVAMKDVVVDRINAHDAAGLWALFDRSLQVEVPPAATGTFVDRMLVERGALRAATRVPEECAADHLSLIHI